MLHTSCIVNLLENNRIPIPDGDREIELYIGEANSCKLLQLIALSTLKCDCIGRKYDGDFWNK